MVTITLSEMLPAGEYDVVRKGDAPQPNPNPLPPQPDPGAPPATGGVLDGFDWMLAHAPEFVAWRWVLQAAPPAVHQALIDRYTMNGYNWKKNDVSYNQPQASYYNGRMYWRDSTWIGAEPQNIMAPGFLSIAVGP